MLAERIVCIDGEFRPWQEATVHIMSHSVGRGSAIFEVIGFHDTKKGPAVFRLDEHVRRFFRSASLLSMTPPCTEQQLMDDILETIRRNTLRRGVIKVLGLYGDIVFNLLPPPRPFQVAVFVFDPILDNGEAMPRDPRGVSACVSRWRRLDPATVPVEAKVAANYINGMLARLDAREKGCDYAVMLDTKGHLAEGGTESFFLCHRGRLLTPALGTILESVTRKSILELARSMGIEATAGQLPPALLAEAEEIFFSSTTAKVLPVWRMDGRILPETPGPVTRRIAARLEAVVAGDEPAFAGWLFPA